ncbi:hypothetical protein [Streptomyces sp. LN325]|uniref:hypothetical protein n=1 Tax=Streptomyces sp. LN325 TaxID=3112976 RepID=UPI0037235492
MEPSEESQLYIAEAFDLPAGAVRSDDWPGWIPLTTTGVVPLGPFSFVPALREALRTAMERRTFLTISGSALTVLAAQWADTDSSPLTRARDGKPIGDDFVALLEDTSRHLAALPTEQRQHTAALLDAHLSTVTDLLEHGRYTPAVGLRLHTLAASLAQTVAWHRFDLGHPPRPASTGSPACTAPTPPQTTTWAPASWATSPTRQPGATTTPPRPPSSPAP